MSVAGAYGDRLGQRFGVPSPPSFTRKALHKTPIAVTLIESDAAADVMSELIPAEEAFLVQLNLRPCPGHELWVDGRALGKRSFAAGETAIHDLRRSPQALIRTPLGSMMFYLPGQLLRDISDDAGVPRVDGIAWEPGVSVDDPIVRGLGQLLVSAVRNDREAMPLFATPPSPSQFMSPRLMAGCARRRSPRTAAWRPGRSDAPRRCSPPISTAGSRCEPSPWNAASR